MAIKHEGKHRERMERECHSTDRERAFAEAWAKENTPEPWLNGGVGTLDHLLCVEPTGRGAHGGLIQEMKRIKDLKQEEATAAATVIQWLGTNVGFCFLQQALNNCGYQVVMKRTDPEVAASPTKDARSGEVQG